MRADIVRHITGHDRGNSRTQGKDMSLVVDLAKKKRRHNALDEWSNQWLQLSDLYVVSGVDGNYADNALDVRWNYNGHEGHMSD